jgi:EH domain-containing protein 1
MFSIEDKRLEVDFYVCSLVHYHANGMSEVISRLTVDSRMALWHGRSFNDKPINEQNDLLADLKDIPRKSCDRRINEFVKRARQAKIHAHIIGHLKKEMPAMMGKQKAQKRLIENLEDEFAKVQREYRVPPGDFPSVEHYRETLSGYNIDKFEKPKPRMIQAVDDMLGYDIPELLKRFRNPYD